MPERTFGVELEIVGLTENKVAEILNNAGIFAITEYFSVYDYDCGECEVCKDLNSCDACLFIASKLPEAWTVKEDGSVHGKNGECEVVSPILSGENGLEVVRKVCALLQANGARVNTTCGLHVHVGAWDLSAEQIKNVAFRYWFHESTIDRFFHRSRRENNNFYCSSVRHTVNILTRERFNVRENIGDHFFNRYSKVNLAALRKYNTIEFRQHNGAFKPETVVNWIKFVVNFVERSKTHPNSDADDSAGLFAGIPDDVKSFYEHRMTFDSVRKARTNYSVMSWA
jgi:hypothetical protein